MIIFIVSWTKESNLLKEQTDLILQTCKKRNYHTSFIIKNFLVSKTVFYLFTEVCIVR